MFRMLTSSRLSKRIAPSNDLLKVEDDKNECAERDTMRTMTNRTKKKPITSNDLIWKTKSKKGEQGQKAW